MLPEPTASNLECALLTLATSLFALLIHLVHYSRFGLKRLLGSAEAESGTEAAFHLMQTIQHRLPGFLFVWAAFASLPVSMWLGVRLMDRGLLSSLWPWVIIPGCALLGLFSALGQAWRRRRLLSLLK